MAQLSRKAVCLLSVKRLLPPHVSVAWASTHKAVIFDMFGVLIPSPLPKATEWEDKNGVPRGTIGQAIRTGGDRNTWRKYMRGELGPEEFLEAFSRDCSQIVGFEVHIGSFHSALTNESMTQPLTVMMEAVRCARAEGLKTAVLSNNFLLPGGKSYMPLDPSVFDVIVESCRVGLCKPDPRIYQLCADRLGVSPQEAVFLDDLSHNVEAAVQVGMHGITVKDPALAVKELEQVLKVPLSGFVPGTRSARQNQQLPMDRLTRYLNSAIQLPQEEPITVREFSHSPSSSTCLLSCGGRQLVLKKRPNPEALRKEHRLLKTLKEVDVPVPDVIALCEEPSVLGTPFYLRSYCQGRIFSDPSLPGLDADGKKCVYEAAIHTLCQIHKVHPKAAGLADLGEPDFMELEVKRWVQQYKANETWHIPAMDRLTEWLLSHLPEQQRTTLLHGNFRVNSLVFDSEKPKVKTVLGWGLSTLGDPLMDVASFCMSHYLCGKPTQAGDSLASVGSVPSTEDVFELYSKAAGLQSIPNWKFYMAFCFFRQAAILQTNSGSAVKGTAGSQHIEDLAELAWDFATKEGFRIFNAMPRAAGF